MATKTKTKKKADSKNHARGSNARWVSGVKTVSTFPPEHVFTKDADEIARVMATKKVSPKGLGSAIRMVQYFINRGGKGLSATRRNELEKAKRILQDMRQKKPSRKNAVPAAAKRPGAKPR
jgi:hypothetical protein